MSHPSSRPPGLKAPSGNSPRVGEVKTSEGAGFTGGWSEMMGSTNATTTKPLNTNVRRKPLAPYKAPPMGGPMN